MYEIGSYLRAALKQRGMTQKELADALGMTKEHISTICLNKRRPSLDALEKICTILGMSFSEFFSEPNSTHSTTLSDNEYSLLCDYRRLEDYERQAVSALTGSLRAGHHSAQQQQSSNSYKREVNGLAAAGSPLYSTVDDESVTVPQKYIDSQRYIIIKAKGDSMVPLIQNGDYVIAEIDSTPCQGELSLVRVESSGYEDEYTIKKFYRYDDEVELHSINTNYSPMFYPLSEIKAAQKIVYIIHQSRNG